MILCDYEARFINALEDSLKLDSVLMADFQKRAVNQFVKLLIICGRLASKLPAEQQKTTCTLMLFGQS